MTTIKRTHVAIVTAIGAAALSGLAHGQWTNDAANNQVIAERTGSQVQPKITTTSDGGSYISWFDNSGSGYDVYLQRLNAGGTPQWMANGILIADRAYSSTQDYGHATTASGDSLLAFRDDRTGSTQITVTRVDASGTQVWGASGVQLTNDAAFKASPKVAAAPDGSIYVAWTSDAAVKVQKLDGSGTPQWKEPVTLSDASGGEYLLSDLVPGEADRVIVSWIRQDAFLAPKHLYTQKLDGTGTGVWGLSPVVVFDAGSLQFGNFPPMVADGSGGAVYAWYSSSPSLQCFVQRIQPDGSAQLQDDGLPVSTNATRARTAPRAAYDAVNDEIYVFWPEQNLGQSQWGLYGQRVADGARQWTDDGLELIAVGTTEITQVRTVLCAESAIVAHVETVQSPFGRIVRARRVDADGADVWTGPFLEVATNVSSKSRLALAGAVGGTKILAWSDDRNRDDPDDLFAQNANPEGTLGKRGDVDASGSVGFPDLTALLAMWGPCGACPADFDCSGDVGFVDLTVVLANWDV